MCHYSSSYRKHCSDSRGHNVKLVSEVLLISINEAGGNWVTWEAVGSRSCPTVLIRFPGVFYLFLRYEPLASVCLLLDCLDDLCVSFNH